MTTRIPDEVAQTAEYGSAPLARQLRWIIGIRLVIVTSVLLPYFLLQLTAPDQELGLDFLYGLAGLTYAASLLYIGLLRLLRGRWALQAFIQFFGDLLLITGLVYYFGGIASPFSILYFIVIIVASALFRRRTGYAVAALAGLLYSATILGLHLGWLPQPAEMFDSAKEIAVDLQPSPTERPLGHLVAVPSWRLIYNLFTHIFGFFMVAYLTTRLAQNIFRAEQELQERQDDLADLQIVHRDVIQSIPSGLITCDLESIVTSANLAAQEILGTTVLELVGWPVTHLGLFSEEQWIELSVNSGAYPRARPETAYRREGILRHIGYSVTPLTNAEEVRTGYILIFQDLSEWRKLQEELRMKDRLAAVGELASGIAHEVGNPLAAISGSVQMLSQSADESSSSSRLLEIILKESQRLDRTIKGFLQFARPKERSNVRFDIAGLLEEHIQLLRNSPEVSPHHTLELEVGPETVSLIADPDQISQIFWNLSRNALRAMPDGGTLKVDGQLQEQSYRIRFTDTGCGMTAAERERMFHPFRSFFDGGTGIGMAIVYRIVEEHGGRLHVDSRRDEGTTITVELPSVQGVVSIARAEA
jgi:two-component system sensor histidine kinase PilS (NtrC family)